RHDRVYRQWMNAAWCTCDSADARSLTGSCRRPRGSAGGARGQGAGTFEEVAAASRRRCLARIGCRHQHVLTCEHAERLTVAERPSTEVGWDLDAVGVEEPRLERRTARDGVERHGTGV